MEGKNNDRKKLAANFYKVRQRPLAWGYLRWPWRTHVYPFLGMAFNICFALSFLFHGSIHIYFIVDIRTD